MEIVFYSVIMLFAYLSKRFSEFIIIIKVLCSNNNNNKLIIEVLENWVNIHAEL